MALDFSPNMKRLVKGKFQSMGLKRKQREARVFELRTFLCTLYGSGLRSPTPPAQTLVLL